MAMNDPVCQIPREKAAICLRHIKANGIEIPVQEEVFTVNGCAIVGIEAFERGNNPIFVSPRIKDQLTPVLG